MLLHFIATLVEQGLFLLPRSIMLGAKTDTERAKHVIVAKYIVL